LRLLDENQRLTVTEVYIRLRLEQSVASQHLAILRRAGFVKTEREGKFIYYMVNAERLSTVNQFVDNLVG
jgi:ArsR family transcriptional regulator, virulence genes transcriptional regulator